jgi:hypothetical protein
MINNLEKKLQWGKSRKEHKETYVLKITTLETKKIWPIPKWLGFGKPQNWSPLFDVELYLTVHIKYYFIKYYLFWLHVTTQLFLLDDRFFYASGPNNPTMEVFIICPSIVAKQIFTSLTQNRTLPIITWALNVY